MRLESKLNAYINVKTAEKNLQFGPDKCNILTIGHKKSEFFENNLYIDHWSEKHDLSDKFIETFEGKI